MAKVTYTKHEASSCPRCSQPFVCNPHNISNCQCSKVELSKEETQFIAQQFSDCVCNNCLMALKYDYYLTYHHNKPISNQ